MKKHLIVLYCTLCTSILIPLGVFAEGSSVADMTLSERLLMAGKLVGYFILMLAALYGGLLLTKKIGEKWGKH